MSKEAPVKRQPRRRAPKPRQSPAALERLNPHAAGIDCGSAEHFVAVPPDRDPTPVHSFPTFTGDLHRLADWLHGLPRDARGDGSHGRLLDSRSSRSSTRAASK